MSMSDPVSLTIPREEMVLESRTLATLHEAPLPNLISGEFRVRGAKRVIGRTAQCPLTL